MARARKQNLLRDLRRLNCITSRQLEVLERKQKGAGLDDTDIAQLKRLSDSLDDQIKLRRVLDIDVQRLARDTPTEILDLIASLNAEIERLRLSLGRKVPTTTQIIPKPSRSGS